MTIEPHHYLATVMAQCVACGTAYQRRATSARQIRCPSCQREWTLIRKRKSEQARAMRNNTNTPRKRMMTEGRMYRVVSDPDESAALARGMLLSKADCDAMLRMGHFTPGTILVTDGRRYRVVMGQHKQELRKIHD